ncbi:MAG: hypothetical protein FDZ75_06565 [Actinobacteria bacterium]|nr:MAG: hypothetical protein FDZ75_06565 [Actinomycetota bacterium]
MRHVKKLPAIIGLTSALVVAGAIAAFALTGTAGPGAGDLPVLGTGLPLGDTAPAASVQTTAQVEERDSEEATGAPTVSGENSSGGGDSASEDGASLNRSTTSKPAGQGTSSGQDKPAVAPPAGDNGTAPTGDGDGDSDDHETVTPPVRDEDAVATPGELKSQSRDSRLKNGDNRK